MAHRPAESPPRPRTSSKAVLQFAWDAGTFRADHAIAALGITRATVLAALDSLIGMGLIREVPRGRDMYPYRLGRPARHFELHAEAGIVVGVDAGDERIVVGVADLAGRVSVRQEFDTPEIRWSGGRTGSDTRARRRAVLRAVDEALAGAGRAREDVVALCLGIPAPVDGQGRSPSHPSGFWQYMNAELQAALSERFAIVRLEFDAALSAIAEGRLGRARDCDDFVTLLTGRRPGAGIVLDGKLAKGIRGGVGELAALTRMTGIGGTAGLEALTDAADGGGPRAQVLGAILGRMCAVLARFHDPARIVVCGASAAAFEEVIRMARRHADAELELPPPQIVASELGGDVVCLGALSAAREAARDEMLRTVS